jgi:hypothetical protein
MLMFWYRVSVIVRLDAVCFQDHLFAITSVPQYKMFW